MKTKKTSPKGNSKKGQVARPTVKVKKATTKKTTPAVEVEEPKTAPKAEVKQSTSSKQVGDRHPKQPWIWTEYKPGKFDWRKDPAQKHQGVKAEVAQTAAPKSSTKKGGKK